MSKLNVEACFCEGKPVRWVGKRTLRGTGSSLLPGRRPAAKGQRVKGSKDESQDLWRGSGGGQQEAKFVSGKRVHACLCCSIWAHLSKNENGNTTFVFGLWNCILSPASILTLSPCVQCFCPFTLTFARFDHTQPSAVPVATLVPSLIICSTTTCSSPLLSSLPGLLP